MMAAAKAILMASINKLSPLQHFRLDNKKPVKVSIIKTMEITDKLDKINSTIPSKF